MTNQVLSFSFAKRIQQIVAGVEQQVHNVASLPSWFPAIFMVSVKERSLSVKYYSQSHLNPNIILFKKRKTTSK